MIDRLRPEGEQDENQFGCGACFMETAKITSAAAALPRPLVKLTAGLLVKASGGFSATKENLKGTKFLGFANGPAPCHNCQSALPCARKQEHDLTSCELIFGEHTHQ